MREWKEEAPVSIANDIRDKILTTSLTSSGQKELDRINHEERATAMAGVPSSLYPKFTSDRSWIAV